MQVEQQSFGQPDSRLVSSETSNQRTSSFSSTNAASDDGGLFDELEFPGISDDRRSGRHFYDVCQLLSRPRVLDLLSDRAQTKEVMSNIGDINRAFSRIWRRRRSTPRGRIRLLPGVRFEQRHLHPTSSHLRGDHAGAVFRGRTHEQSERRSVGVFLGDAICSEPSGHGSDSLVMWPIRSNEVTSDQIKFWGIPL